MLLALFVLLLIFFVVFPLIGMALWAVFSTLLVGLVLGAVARLIVPGPQRIGLFPTALAGAAGAILGGFLGDRVLYTGGFETLLLEIGVAALLVMGMASPRRRLSRLR